MPKEKFDSIRILIDYDVQNTMYGSTLISYLLREGFVYETRNMPIKNSIAVRRIIENSFSNNEEIDQPFCIVIWDHDVLMPLIKHKELNLIVEKLSQSIPRSKVILALCGISTYFRNIKDHLKKKSNERPVHRSEFEWSVTELQIKLGVDHRVLNNSEEFCLFVKQFVKSITEIPQKKELYEKDLLTDGCAMDRLPTVAVSGSHGLARLFKEQLMSFTGVTLEIAEAIIIAYPTIRSLIQAYKECSAGEGAALLSTLPVRRNIGPLSKARHIGPDISKRIYLYYMSNDGSIIIDECD